MEEADIKKTKLQVDDADFTQKLINAQGLLESFGSTVQSVGQFSAQLGHDLGLITSSMDLLVASSGLAVTAFEDFKESSEAFMSIIKV
ncbi:hypothetical protein JZO86_12090 [Enterococcus ureasiticus]|uniref:hypothetical protein n=1 Tax=Enterococcus ureasiticus TaxID=903984 RepID=UPI001A8D6DB7|nr:hypothetical protein [Enterococcus ureasiticus]MBO0474439.1 hypothetical protein [Enterococcus ureasiticus]